MAEQNKKDIFDLGEAEFVEYFKEKVVPYFNEVQVQIPQQTYTFLIIFIVMFFGLPCLGVFLFLIILIISSPAGFTEKMPLMAVLLFVLAFIFSTIFFAYMIIKLVKAKRSKTSFVSKNKLFKYLGLEYFSMRWSQQKDICTLQKVINVYQEILLYTFWIRRGIDEIIKSAYHSIPFTIIEQMSIEENYGLVLTTKINKTFKKDLWIRSSFGVERALCMVEYQTPVYEEIVLEDINFAKEYKIYGKDQVEARYLLTPTFMDRLLKYKSKKRCKVEVFFSQKYSEYGNVFFYIETPKNMFELPVIYECNVEKIAKDTYNVVKEIKEILEIIDALKLDQDIGM